VADQAAASSAIPGRTRPRKILLITNQEVLS